MRPLAALTILFILGCTGEGTAPAPERPTTEPVAEPEVVAASAPAGLCVAGETARFSCGVKGGKTVSLCAKGAAMTYRFGKPGGIELSVLRAAGSDGAWEVSQQALGADSERHIASVWNDGYRYAVVADRTEDQFEGKVVVRQGVKKIATLTCLDQPIVNFTELGSDFGGDPSSPNSWVGRWDVGTASFTITHDADGFHLVDGMAFYEGMNGRNTGEASGPLKRQTTHTLIHESDGCSITLARSGPDLIDGTDNLGCGGMNVTFMGDYRRVP